MRRIRIARFDGNGDPSWNTTARTALYIDGTSLQSQRWGLLGDAQGGGFIAYAEVTLSDYRIILQKVSADGSLPWGSSGVVVGSFSFPSGSSASIPEPALALDGAGGAHIAWSEFPADGSGFRVRIQHVTGSGIATWTPGGKILTAGPAKNLNPMLVGENEGGITVIYWRLDTSFSIGLQRLDADGNELFAGGGVQVAPSALLDGAEGAVSLTAARLVDNSIVVGYYRMFPAFETWVQRVRSDGSCAWGTSGLLLGVDRVFDAPLVIPSENGDCIVQWCTISGGLKARAQRIDTSGVSSWGADGVVLRESGYASGWRRLLNDGSGANLSFWFQGDPKKIYAQRFSHSGEILWQESGRSFATDHSVSVSESEYAAVRISESKFLIVWTLYLTNVFAQLVGAIVTTDQNFVRAELRLRPEWNLLSYPLTRDGADLRPQFPERLTELYSYVGQYVADPTLSRSKGFWLKYPTESLVELSGYVSTLETLAIHRGWNLVGLYADSMQVSNLSTIPPGAIVSDFYGYDGSYSANPMLDQGRGYWVKSRQEARLVSNMLLSRSPRPKSITDASERWDRLVFTDATGRRQVLLLADAPVFPDRYELPPLPPSPGFEVTFSGRVVAARCSEDGTPLEIGVRHAVYPLSIEFESRSSIAGKRTLVDEQGRNVYLSGRAVIRSGNSDMKFYLSSDGLRSLPVASGLKPNVPNPFNPSTRIEYALMLSADVTLTVYDLLGREVETLVSGMVDAGDHAVVWNADRYASGTYLCRLSGKARDGRVFSSVRTLLLIK